MAAALQVQGISEYKCHIGVTLSGTLCIADGDNAADDDQMETVAAVSGSKRGAHGEKRDDDKVMKVFGVSNVHELA